VDERVLDYYLPERKRLKPVDDFLFSGLAATAAGIVLTVQAMQHPQVPLGTGVITLSIGISLLTIFTVRKIRRWFSTMKAARSNI
jgi:hypothetical protein